MFTKIRQLAEFYLVVFIISFARIIPFSLRSFLGNLLGSFAYYFVPIRKKHAIKSLQDTFPEKNLSEILTIVHRLYQNLGQILANYCLFFSDSTKDIASKIEYVGLDVLKKARDQGRGVILTGGHFGNWEALGIATAMAGFPISLVVAPIRNPYLNKMITGARKHMGVQLISKKGMAVRYITKALKEKRCVGMLIDQDAGRTGTFVDFFGRPSSTPKGPAKYAVSRDLPIVMLFCFPQDDGTLEIVFEEVAFNPASDDESTIQQVTQQMTSRLEYYIRQNPSNWFGWLHRRWKTEPPSP